MTMINELDINDKLILILGGILIGLIYAVLPKYPLSSLVMFCIVATFSYILIKY